MFNCLKKQKTYVHESVSGWSEVELSAEYYIDSLKSDISTLKRKIESLTDDLYENTPEYKIVFNPIKPSYMSGDHSDFQVQKRCLRKNSTDYNLRGLYSFVKGFSTREAAEKGLVTIKKEYNKNQ